MLGGLSLPWDLLERLGLRGQTLTCVFLELCAEPQSRLGGVFRATHRTYVRRLLRLDPGLLLRQAWFLRLALWWARLVWVRPRLHRGLLAQPTAPRRGVR